MKPKRLSEVRALIASDDFSSWFSGLEQARTALRTAQAQHEELLAQANLTAFRAELLQKNAIDTLYRAGEHDDAAATMLFESTELENRSFKGIGEFEEQRIRASDAWYRLGAAEKQRDEADEQHRPADVVEALARAARFSNQEYERENERKERLWDEVESHWARSAEVSLLLSEQKALGRKVRHQAELLFGTTAVRSQQAKALQEQTQAAADAVEAATAHQSALLEQAHERFGCATGTDFVFFRNADDPQLAWCVCLIADRDGYNLEVKPLTVYQADLKRGVQFLSPARDTGVSSSPGARGEAVRDANEANDRRFEEYFLKGRKGELHAG